jgi:hypothetical protein
VIPYLETNIGIIGSLLRNPDANGIIHVELVSISQPYEGTTLIRNEQMSSTLVGMMNRRRYLELYLDIYDEDFNLFTKLEAVQLRVCETNPELRAAIQTHRASLSDRMRTCESKMSSLEDECEIVHAPFRPVLDKTLRIVGASMIDRIIARALEPLPAYTPRS